MSEFKDYMNLRPTDAAGKEECHTPQGMRKRINEFAYKGDLFFVKAILDQARYQGLSGDDAMTWLAFEALCHAQQLQEMVLENFRRSPFPPVILKEPK